MKSNDLKILKLVVFRENMSASLTIEDAKRICGEKTVENLDRRVLKLLKKEKQDDIWQKKLKKAQNDIEFFLIFNLVSHICVSGSVGAQNAKEGDDIDLFIVVRKNCAWIYRLLLQIKNIFAKKIRVGKSIEVADMYCVNLICEEHFLKFEDDMFTFHELIFMKPIYNEAFYDEIIKENSWVPKYGYMNSFESVKTKKDVKNNPVIFMLNILSMILQIKYMYLSFHNPNLRRILGNFKKGRIAFHPEGFKSEKEKNFIETFEKRVSEFKS